MSINHCLFLVPAILSLHLNAPESLCVSLSCMYPCIGLVFSQVPTPTLLGDRNIGPPSSPDVRIVRERCSDSRIPGPGDRVEPHCRSLSLSLSLAWFCVFSASYCASHTSTGLYQLRGDEHTVDVHSVTENLAACPPVS